MRSFPLLNRMRYAALRMQPARRMSSTTNALAVLIEAVQKQEINTITRMAKAYPRLIVDQTSNDNTALHEARKISYQDGLDANPDFVRAKQEGRREGEREGYKKAEMAAEERIKEANEKVKQVKTQAVEDYIYNQKFSTRLRNVKIRLVNSRNKSPRELHSGLFINKIQKLIGEIPLSFHSYEVTQRSGARWDKLRIKDLPHGTFMKRNFGGYDFEYHVSTRIMFQLSLVVGCILASMKFYDLYLHGETPKQYFSRKRTIRACKKLASSTPETFGTTYLTWDEERQRSVCNQYCSKATLFHDKMPVEMKARRGSGYGNKLFFGPRSLAGVYNDSSDTSPPLILNIDSLNERIFARVAEEDKLRREASKKQKYDSILAEEEAHNQTPKVN